MTSIPPRPRHVARTRNTADSVQTAYPRTEIGESFLVNAEWHGPRCASNRTGMYRDCDCTLIREIVALEAEAAAIPAQDSRPLKEAARDLAYRVQAIAKDYGQDHQPTGDWPEVWRAWDRFMAEYARLAEDTD